MLPLISIGKAVKDYFAAELGVNLPDSKVVFNPTRKEFEGDYTLVVFPLSGMAKMPPPVLAETLGEHLVDSVSEVDRYQVVKGFLNLTLSNRTWLDSIDAIKNRKPEDFYAERKKIIVEFSSPNTNKPLHLGHIRNILLGWSVSRLLEKSGNEVYRTQVINDRGIAICKSMLSWQKFGQGATPESTGIKGDHFVGKWYVKFENSFKAEYVNWQKSGEGLNTFKTQAKEGEQQEDFFKRIKNNYFNEYSLLGREAREMLLKWESGDPHVIALWKQMNAWVYEGFEETYNKLGVRFDGADHESDTYLLGKQMIEYGLNKKVFYKQDDGSVWVDLEAYGMDKKILLRSDGTSVYMTQDLGTANSRYEREKMDSMVYTVADEQNYHFKALFAILDLLGEPYAKGLHHLSYGMVDLPTGKMKSREGTVVDADDLMDEVIQEARKNARERGELEVVSEVEQEEIIRKIGLAALKYHILKVDPKKRMIFDPAESVDLQGQTGPYIQNAFVRIKSVMRKADLSSLSVDWKKYEVKEGEKLLIKHLLHYPEEIKNATDGFNPSLLAHYVYDLARMFHRFYHDYPILKSESEEATRFRLMLSNLVADTLSESMDILGIEMPDRM